MKEISNSLLLILWRDLEKGTQESFNKRFAAYCTTVLQLRRDASISNAAAATFIAHAMFIPGLDVDPLREEITICAGELELPMAADEISHWARLDQLINELNRTNIL